jgi:hypothetical protein
MSVVASTSATRAAVESRWPTPPPIPADVGGHSANFLDETDDEMRRLMVDIDRVLSGRPGLRLVQGDIAVDPFEPDDHFVWQGREGEAQSDQAAGPTAGWLDRAKRARKFERVRSAMAWMVVIAIVAGISGTAAMLAVGSLPVVPHAEVLLNSIGL